MPLHDALPMLPVGRRHEDKRIRYIGYLEEEHFAHEAAELMGKRSFDEAPPVVSLVQLFAPNFYSFTADALSRLNLILSGLSTTDREKLVVAIPSNGGRLRNFMWPLLSLFGINKGNSVPYPIRSVRQVVSTGVDDASAPRLRAKRFLLLDFVPVRSDWRVDTAHLPSRYALRSLRESLLFHLGLSQSRDMDDDLRVDSTAGKVSQASEGTQHRKRLLYIRRSTAAVRRISNEEAMLEMISAELDWCSRHNGGIWREEPIGVESTTSYQEDGMPAPVIECELRVLDDVYPLPLFQTARLMSSANVVLGVHGAGWANILFCVRKRTSAVELALPESHAIYTAHLAAALGLSFEAVALRGAGLHSAAKVRAPIARLKDALRRALRWAGSSDWASESSNVVSATNRAASAMIEFASSNVYYPERLKAPSHELVVARFDEDPSWCRPYNCTVYNKGSPLVGVRGRFRVVELPNIGRESHTWLWHITHRWRNGLADRTTFMQADPHDHLLPGVDISFYVNSSSDVFMPITAAATVDLRRLAHRDGFAPFAPFGGEFSEPFEKWRARNRARLRVLLQPSAFWHKRGGYNQSLLPPSFDRQSAMPLLDQPLHWVTARARAQRSRKFATFWRDFLGIAPPPVLYHAQGAQFTLSKSAILHRPYSLYRTLLDELRGNDPVAGYYLELMWWEIFVGL
eukprot:scaffold39294_cov34-Tisochrysis_lutea.AAC.5